MSKVSTQSMPLDSPPGTGGGKGFEPLSWLRRRLFKPRTKRPPREAITLVAFPPPLGRGHALRLAHRALHELFGQQEGLRQVLPHLSLLEQALGRKGSKALRRLPTQVLHRALEQLEDLQTSENHVDLATLRTRLVETLALRSVITPTDTGPGSGPGVPLSMFGVEVQEASHSAFNEAERHWTTAGSRQPPRRQ